MDTEALLKELPDLSLDSIDELFTSIYEMCATQELREKVSNFGLNAVFTDEEINSPGGPPFDVQMTASCDKGIAFQNDKASLGWNLIVVRFGEDMNLVSKQYPKTHIRFLHYKDGKIIDVTEIEPFTC